MIKSCFGIGKNKNDPRACISEAVKDFKDPKLIIYFSDKHNFAEYSEMLHEIFPNAVCIGSMTYRTWDSSGTETDVLKVLSIESGITCSAGVINKADDFALDYIDRIRESFNEIGESENTICVEFTVPYKLGEEYALMALNSVLLRHEIPIIGGTASNTDVFAEAFVSLNGRIYSEGCVYVLIHSLEGKIHLYSENIYEPLTGKKLTVTKANSKTRTIMNYDGKPAADAYANELGITVDDIPNYIFSNPIGQCIGDDIFLTAIKGVGSNGSLKHLARVHEGTDVIVMKEGDIRAITAETIDKIKKKHDSPSLVMMFNCVARTILFENHGYINEYQQLLANAFPKFIGLSCLGEQLGTKNFNHTMMLAVFE